MSVEYLRAFLKKRKGKRLLAIFAHPDDESFVSGGLFQVAKEIGLKAELICLTKGERGLNSLGKGNLKQIRNKELQSAGEILGIDKFHLWNYPDVNLRKTKAKWLPKVKAALTTIKPNIVLTFDHSGVTGHPDHIISCHEVLNLVKQMKKKPILLWRVPDERERDYFNKNKALPFASKPNLVLEYGLEESIRKIRAIYSHRSQMKSLGFKLQILEWFLFDHKELYYKVDLKRDYKYKFVPYKI